jgi:hypothetical protein
MEEKDCVLALLLGYHFELIAVTPNVFPYF